MADLPTIPDYDEQEERLACIDAAWEARRDDALAAEDEAREWRGIVADG